MQHLNDPPDRPPADDRTDLELVRDAVGALSEARTHLEAAQSVIATHLAWLNIRLTRHTGGGNSTPPGPTMKGES